MGFLSGMKWPRNPSTVPSGLAEHVGKLYVDSSTPETVAFWRGLRKACGLGRSEFVPVRKVGAITEYVGKYLEAEIRIRVNGWKGARRVETDRPIVAPPNSGDCNPAFSRGHHRRHANGACAWERLQRFSTRPISMESAESLHRGGRIG